MPQDDFEKLVSEHYEPLYRFAFSLTQAEADAWDLTQQTFYIWSTKGHQLRDVSKAKTWLFTTLHRAFLAGRQKQARFPQFELDESQSELPVIAPEVASRLDSAEVLRALTQVEEIYQAAIALFYLEDCSYLEIAEILQIPIGTVKSRLARGLIQLRQILLSAPNRNRTGINRARTPGKPVPAVNLLEESRSGPLRCEIPANDEFIHHTSQPQEPA